MERKKIVVGLQSFVFGIFLSLYFFLPFFQFFNVSAVGNAQCSFHLPSEIKTGNPFTVSVTASYEKNGTNPYSGPAVLVPDQLGYVNVAAQKSINISNGQATVQFSGDRSTFSEGQLISFILYSGSPIGDGYLDSNFMEDYADRIICKSGDLRIKDNKSQAGGACDPQNAISCATYVCSAEGDQGNTNDYFCAAPCGSDNRYSSTKSCLEKRYDRESGSCDRSICDCDKVISTFELPINGTVLPNQGSVCGTNQRCTETREATSPDFSKAGNFGGTVSICHPLLKSACQTENCDIIETSGSITVQQTCLRPEDYTFQIVDTAKGGQVLFTSGFKVTTNSPDTITIPAPVALGSDVTPYLEVVNKQGQKVCGITGSLIPKDSNASAGFALCSQIPLNATGSDGVKLRDKCSRCTGVWTSLGCIPVNNTGILSSLVRIGLSIAGGVALLMIIAASFMLTTSQGDQKRVTEARDLITSAVIGLIFIIVSVTLLQFIGVSILHLPGFGT